MDLNSCTTITCNKVVLNETLSHLQITVVFANIEKKVFKNVLAMQDWCYDRLLFLPQLFSLKFLSK